MALKILSFIIILLSIPPGCQHTQHREGVTPVDTVENQLPNATSLTASYENEMASFSPDGKKLLFLSKRPPHINQRQIYELDLHTGKGRRITYNDGDNSSPIYISRGRKILYTSSTDEIKEKPELLQAYIKNPQRKSPYLDGFDLFPQFEIYISGLDGENVKRITNSDHFDGHPNLHPKGTHLLFSSVRSGKYTIYRYNMRRKKVQPVVKRSPFHNIFPSYSKDGKKITWVRVEETKPLGTIMIADAMGKKEKVALPVTGLFKKPIWHPVEDSIIFSAQIKEEENFHLYSFNFKNSCLQKLTQYPGDSLHPSLSPSGEKLVFTNNHTGKKQLYALDLNSLHKEPCLFP